MTSTQHPIVQKIQEAVSKIRTRTELKPVVGLILGSGLGPVADQLKKSVAISYDEIPHFHKPSVQGHAGQLLLGEFEGVPTAILQGRFHYYEGYTMEQVALPTRVLCHLGIKTLVLTNAAGGINTRYRPGELMVIQDHINLMGDSPLKGPNIAQFGPRFPDLTEAYSKKHVAALTSAAERIGLKIHQGVYAGLVGPAYETPAEVRMLRTMGADTVGMSTVPETIAARHLGVKVAGLSCITNLAAGITDASLTHEEVMEIGQKGAKSIALLLNAAITDLSKGAA